MGNRDYPRKAKKTAGVLSAVTAPAQSAVIDGRQNPNVIIWLKVTGGSVDFKFQPVVSNLPGVNFGAANNNGNNAYSICGVVDKTGEIVDAPVTISAAGTYMYELNWNSPSYFGVQLLDGVGSFAGTVTVDIEQYTS